MVGFISRSTLDSSEARQLASSCRTGTSPRVMGSLAATEGARGRAPPSLPCTASLQHLSPRLLGAGGADRRLDVLFFLGRRQHGR